jgi:hypothetical protein
MAVPAAECIQIRGAIISARALYRHRRVIVSRWSGRRPRSLIRAAIRPSQDQTVNRSPTSTERHREYRSSQVGGGDGDLRFARDQRRRRVIDEA